MHFDHCHNRQKPECVIIPSQELFGAFSQQFLSTQNSEITSVSSTTSSARNAGPLGIPRSAE